MKRLLFLFLLVTSSLLSHALCQICYPGSDCFGSNGSCSAYPWNACSSSCPNPNGCCCTQFTRIVSTPASEYELDLFTDAPWELEHHREEGSFSVVGSFTPPILADYEIFQFTYRPELSRLVLVVYDKRILDAQMEEKGAINKTLARLRSIQYII
jgi:hypothetical protein